MRPASDPGKPENPYRFVGKSGYYSDDETGLQLLGARYYDPLLGRFITQDPSRDGLNWYAYCGNNPVNAVDPTGRTPEEGFQAVAEYHDAIQRVAGRYGIQPQLLAGVVWREMSGGRIISHGTNELASTAKFVVLGRKASLGITQRQISPKAEGLHTAAERLRFVDRYLDDVDGQLSRGAALLKHLARRRYGEDFGSLDLGQMGIVLTEYNMGETSTPNELARPSERYGRPVMAQMGNILDVLQTGVYSRPPAPNPLSCGADRTVGGSWRYR